ncbi:hypothetical protein V1527DRAFT_483199 [Lipomyces starkeyi]
MREMNYVGLLLEGERICELTSRLSSPGEKRRPLDDPRYRHMYTVSLLMIHALRHGLVVQEVLAHAVDGRVVWTFPDRLVLCTFTRGVNGGRVKYILTRVYTHGTRLGAAQDVAYLPQESLGSTTNVVRQSLRHTNKAFQDGITDAYAASPTQEFYNDRAKREFVHRWGAQFSNQSAIEFIKKPVIEEEIRDWQDRNEKPDEDPNCQKAKRGARYNIQRSVMSSSSRPQCQTQGRGTIQTSRKPLRCPRSLQVGKEATGSGSNISPDAGNPSTSAVMDVDTNEADRLNSQLFLKDTWHGNDQLQTDFDDAALCEEQVDSDSADKVQITASELVSAYASINVVDNIPFARAWPNYVKGKTSLAEGIGQHSVRGNSRNDPTPLEFHCRKTRMCPYGHIRRDILAAHELFCSESLVARAVAKEEPNSGDCSGCSEAFATKKALFAHIRRDHKFQQKACPDGCKVYTTLSGYNLHMDKRYSDRWAKLCRYPECNDSMYNDTLLTVGISIEPMAIRPGPCELRISPRSL